MKKIILAIAGIIMIGLLQSNIAIADDDEELGYGYNGRIEGINVFHTNDPSASDEAMFVVIKVIDRILSLVSVVAVVIFLIGGFKVLLSNGDETKAKGGYKIIKNATIGLIIIGLTRGIVRLIFRFINGAAGDGDLGGV